MDGREPLYLQPGMSEAELFREFNARDPYYRHIAARLVALVRLVRPNFGRTLDIFGRTGYLTRAAMAHASSVVVIEHRPAFAEYLRGEFAADHGITILEGELFEALRKVAIGVDTALCCEQAHFLQPKYEEFVKLLAAVSKGALLGMTLGPSHHRFATMRLSDFRSGAVRAGTMVELSHPIHQAVHAEILKIVRERHGYERQDAWPPAAVAYDLAAVRAANEAARFRNLMVIEETFPVSGHQIHRYGQNGWTSFFRWPPLADLGTDVKISICREAVTSVRNRSEYDDWCKVTAYHPVAYLIAF